MSRLSIITATFIGCAMLSACTPTYHAPEAALDLKTGTNKKAIAHEVILVRTRFVSDLAATEIEQSDCTASIGTDAVNFKSPYKIAVPVSIGIQPLVRITCSATIGPRLSSNVVLVQPRLLSIANGESAKNVYPDEIHVSLK